MIFINNLMYLTNLYPVITQYNDSLTDLLLNILIQRNIQQLTF